VLSHLPSLPLQGKPARAEPTPLIPPVPILSLPGGSSRASPRDRATSSKIPPTWLTSHPSRRDGEDQAWISLGEALSHSAPAGQPCLFIGAQQSIYERFNSINSSYVQYEVLFPYARRQHANDVQQTQAATSTMVRTHA
jgi:hypothetical protein